MIDIQLLGIPIEQKCGHIHTHFSLEIVEYVDHRGAIFHWINLVLFRIVKITQYSSVVYCLVLALMLMFVRLLLRLLIDE